jgi:hypothetical protein
MGNDCLGRKNYLVCGIGYRRRTRARDLQIIGSAKLTGLDPEACLREMLTRIANYPIYRIDELLPWNIGASPAEMSTQSIRGHLAKLCTSDAYL